jgi:hypothetical protein
MRPPVPAQCGTGYSGVGKYHIHYRSCEKKKEDDDPHGKKVKKGISMGLTPFYS